jgi:hypothetical protein
MIWIALIIILITLGAMISHWSDKHDREVAIKNGQKPMPRYDHLGGLFATRHRSIKDPDTMERLIKEEEERRLTEKNYAIIAEIKREEELAKYKAKYPARFGVEE